jgi:hypothetical protein
VYTSLTMLSYVEHLCLQKLCGGSEILNTPQCFVRLQIIAVSAAY